MLENLFYESLSIIQCILRNKNKTTTLVNTYATKFGFIDKKFMKIVCKTPKIQLQCLPKLKLISGFDSRVAKFITDAIYPTLSMRNHSKSLAFLLIIKLKQYFMILGCL